MTTRLSLALASALALFGCSDDGDSAVTASVADHADALTANPGDNIATFTLDGASEAFMLTSSSFTVAEVGMTALQVNFTLVDGNGDGKLGEGESVTLIEPGLNKFDTTSIGKSYEVTFRVAGTGDVLRQLAVETWTPSN
jgi:hypothetical protein